MSPSGSKDMRKAPDGALPRFAGPGQGRGWFGIGTVGRLRAQTGASVEHEAVSIAEVGRMRSAAAGKPAVSRPDYDGSVLDLSADLLADLDPAQREAVLATTGPVCILAGAGTGKTRRSRAGSAMPSRPGPWRSQHVLVVTFTDKAAGELRSGCHAR